MLDQSLPGSSDSSVGWNRGCWDLPGWFGAPFVLGNVRPGFLGVLGVPWIDGFLGGFPGPNKSHVHTFYTKHSATQNYIY